MKVNYIFSSNVGLKRLYNEDFLEVIEVDDGVLSIVCDGLGGNNSGEVASRLTVETIKDSFRNSDSYNYLDRIKKAVGEANAKVLAAAKSDSNLTGMATTAEVLFVKEHDAYWGHVGDSRIYQFSNGILIKLTKDHSLVQKLLDEGYLTLKEAENHPNKNIIMRAIGENETIEIDLSKIRLNPFGDFKFFVCTDGVTSVVSDAELENIFKEKDISKLSEKINNLVEERGAPDNYSYVIISKLN